MTSYTFDIHVLLSSSISGLHMVLRQPALDDVIMHSLSFDYLHSDVRNIEDSIKAKLVDLLYFSIRVISAFASYPPSP